MWLYGDTILAFAGEDGSSWRDNTWSWTDDLAAPTGFAEPVDGLGAPAELFPETPEEAAYNVAHRGDPCVEPCGGREILWPMDAVETDVGALVFYVKIHGEPGEWSFFGRGIGVAQWTDFEAGPFRPEPRVVDGEPTLLFGPDEPELGIAAWVHEGWVYAFGAKDAEKHQVVGRVRPESVQDRAAWVFWDGSAWSGEIGAAATVFRGSSQEKVWFDDTLDTWLALYLEGFGERMVLRSAPAPEGPWSEEVTVIETEPANEGWPYCGIAHPEFGGGLVATYYRSTAPWEGEIRVVQATLEAR
ncbi:MAG: DUF4185 domain-containing protein [Alphaproteobacteria bacterium]|nr:DUF4185 domain-containing protein [Alphaproteobacteria bacterium]